MPEGHTIHRYARAHRRHLAGRRLRVWSPQGRFDPTSIDGEHLLDVEAVGKHLFYRWGNGETLHVHLGLFGKFRRHDGAAPPPTPATRVAMAGDGTTLYLSGPTVCDLIDPDEVEAIGARLGPDPLDPKADPERFARALARRRGPIGAALLDQKAVAGVGNVYRAEVLFLCGIHPDRPANALTGDEVARLWDVIVSELTAGARLGRIVTVDPDEVGAASRARIPRGERLYAYKRDGRPCRRCGTDIARWELGARSMWACPSCQPA